MSETLGTTAPTRKRKASKRPPYRPRLDNEKRSAYLAFRMCEAEAQSVKAAAAALGENLSEFLVTAALRRAELVQADQKEIC